MFFSGNLISVLCEDECWVVCGETWEIHAVPGLRVHVRMFWIENQVDSSLDVDGHGLVGRILMRFVIRWVISNLFFVWDRWLVFGTEKKLFPLETNILFNPRSGTLQWRTFWAREVKNNLHKCKCNVIHNEFNVIQRKKKQNTYYRSTAWWLLIGLYITDWNGSCRRVEANVGWWFV